jgi:hypothetical protein
VVITATRFPNTARIRMVASRTMALQLKQFVRRLAGFLQGGKIGLHLSLCGDEVANRLAMPRDRDRRGQLRLSGEREEAD